MSRSATSAAAGDPASAARSHGRFALQLLRRLSRAPAAAWQREAEEAHEAEVAELAARSGLGERLLRIDALKFTGADAARAATGLLRQGTKLAAGATLVVLAAMLIWASTWQAVDRLMVGFAWKTFLTLVLYVVFGGIALAALVAAALRVPRDEPPRPLRAAADRIAAIAGVPLVAFGHTHEEGVSRVAGGRAWYFNTGTWIAVFTHDELLPRERVQYVFLRVRGAEGELLQWSPGRARPMPVVLLEEAVAGAGRPARDDAVRSEPTGEAARPAASR